MMRRIQALIRAILGPHPAGGEDRLNWLSCQFMKHLFEGEKMLLKISGRNLYTAMGGETMQIQSQFIKSNRNENMTNLTIITPLVKFEE